MKDFGLNLFRNYYHEGREEHEEKQKVNLANLPSEAKTGITYVPTCYFPNVGVILERKLLKRIGGFNSEVQFQ